MRRGSLNKQYLKVRHKGKEEPVLRGPYFVLTTKERGKTLSRRIRKAGEIKKIRGEVNQFHEFQKISKELIEINEKICELMPIPFESENSEEDGDSKKKLRKQLKRKQGER